MGIRIYCPIHKEEQLHNLVYNIGPKKGERRVGKRGDTRIYFCAKCNKAYNVKIVISALKTD